MGAVRLCWSFGTDPEHVIVAKEMMNGGLIRPSVIQLSDIPQPGKKSPRPIANADQHHSTVEMRNERISVDPHGPGGMPRHVQARVVAQLPANILLKAHNKRVDVDPQDRIKIVGQRRANGLYFDPSTPTLTIVPLDRAHAVTMPVGQGLQTRYGQPGQRRE